MSKSNTIRHHRLPFESVSFFEAKQSDGMRSTYLFPSCCRRHLRASTRRSSPGCRGSSRGRSECCWWREVPGRWVARVGCSARHPLDKRRHLCGRRLAWRTPLEYPLGWFRARGTIASKTRRQLFKRTQLPRLWVNVTMETSQINLLWLPHWPTCNVMISLGIDLKKVFKLCYYYLLLESSSDNARTSFCKFKFINFLHFCIS